MKNAWWEIKQGWRYERKEMLTLFAILLAYGAFQAFVGWAIVDFVQNHVIVINK